MPVWLGVKMDVIIVLTIWFGMGFLTMIALYIKDMRGQPFNEDYFKNQDNLCGSLSCILLGPISVIIVLGVFWIEHKLFTKFVYKIANIGIKKKEENPDDTSV